MADVLDLAEVEPTVLHTGPRLRLDDDELFELCSRNKELRIERTSDGNLIIMSPECGASSSGGASLVHAFLDWARRDGTGRVFDSNGGFVLRNGAMRSPDVSWVLNKRLAKLTDEEWSKFLPLCPDFVLELRSPTDRLSVLQSKLEEYIANGARLGWLLDPKSRQVHIYRPRKAVEILRDPKEVSGESVLPGFVLDVPAIWKAGKRPTA